MVLYVRLFPLPIEWNLNCKRDHFVSIVGTEELGHLEMVGTLVTQLTKGAPPKEWKELNSWEYYADNGNCVFPQNAQGTPFNAASIAVTGDPLKTCTKTSQQSRKQEPYSVYP